VASREAPQLPREEVDALFRELQDWLQAGEVAAALSSRTYPPGARVQTELPFAVRAEEVVLQGRMDRVVLVEEEGRVVAGHVLDYKTDEIRSGDRAGLHSIVGEYEGQLVAYRRSLAQLFGLEPERVRASLVLLSAGQVADL
jgi:ATP-dependent exoDNAse (exonuclease V) beta subunit